jgi:preprotein translocase subunit SecD
MKRAWLGVAITAATLPVPAMAETITLSVTRTKVVTETNNEHAVVIELSDESRRALGEFTYRMVGKQINVRVNGKIVAQPFLRGAIHGHHIMVHGSGTAQDAQAIAATLRNQGVLTVDDETFRTHQ